MKTQSPWQQKYDGPISDLDIYNTSDKGYIPKRHVFHKDYPETFPEVVEELIVCLHCPFYRNYHWVVRKWMGDEFSLTSMDEAFEIVAWIRMPPPPLSIKHYITHGE